MNTYYPSYYDLFSCAASDCPDTCCAKWEIVIDDETYRFYMNEPGEYADKVRSCIIEDDDGDHCFGLIDGRCPFLNSEGLCDIHIFLGEEHTCGVCKEHPRFTEEYDGFTEISLSLSCPEACHLILTSELSGKTYPVPVSDGSDELLDELIRYRASVIDTVVRKGTKPAADELLGCALKLQAEIDEDEYEFNADFKTFFDKEWFAFLLNETEILTDEWRAVLTECLNDDNYPMISFKKTEKIFAYFVYRYGLKAINDEDVIGYALYIISAVCTSVMISEKTKVSLEEAARLYSKETEHDPENIELIRDYLCSIY